MKYKDWLELWLQNNIRPTTKKRTYIRYNELINMHIMPKLGEYELNEINALSLQMFITNLLQSGNKKMERGFQLIQLIL